jgi:hypothetical protein
MTTNDDRPPDDEDLGMSAVRLFHLCATANQCDNHALLHTAISTSHRVVGTLPSNDWDLDSSHILPTSARLKAAVARDDRFGDRVRCQCELCESHSMPRTTAISGIDLSNEDSLKELAIILLCGCLFALKKFLYHRSEPGSTVFDFAEEVRRVPGMLFHTASPSFIAVECDHVWWRDGRLFVDLCALCKAKAFRAAVYLKKRITWIPMLERTGNVVSYDNRNIPFIREVPALRERIRPNPQFFTVSIEPTRFNNELAVCIPFLL